MLPILHRDGTYLQVSKEGRACYIQMVNSLNSLEYYVTFVSK